MSRRIPRIQRCAVQTHIQPRAASKFFRLILTSSISELLTSQEKHAQQQRRLYRYLERVVRSEYQSCVTTFDWLATQMPQGSLIYWPWFVHCSCSLCLLISHGELSNPRKSTVIKTLSFSGHFQQSSIPVCLFKIYQRNSPASNLYPFHQVALIILVLEDYSFSTKIVTCAGFCQLIFQPLL